MSICMKCGDTHAKSCEQNTEQRRLIEQLRREADDADRERARFASELAAECGRADALVYACKAFGLDASGHDSVPLLTRALAEIARSRVSPKKSM